MEDLGYQMCDALLRIRIGSQLNWASRSTFRNPSPGMQKKAHPKQKTKKFNVGSSEVLKAELRIREYFFRLRIRLRSRNPDLRIRIWIQEAINYGSGRI
jgi:hypothetical protein